MDYTHTCLPLLEGRAIAAHRGEGCTQTSFQIPAYIQHRNNLISTTCTETWLLLDYSGCLVSIRTNILDNAEVCIHILTVSARMITSRPASIHGMACICTGVGACVYSTLSIAYMRRWRAINVHSMLQTILCSTVTTHYTYYYSQK